LPGAPTKLLEETLSKEKAMNTKIRRILCATDLSGNCDHLYSCAMNLAIERDASLMVLHVISQRSIKAAKTLAYYLNESQKDVVKEKAYSALQRMKEQLSTLFKKELKDHPDYVDHIEHLLVSDLPSLNSHNMLFILYIC
jgi:nucleotide-binding universal stress UspA family protein